MGNQRNTGPQRAPNSAKPQQPTGRPKLDVAVAKLTDTGRVRPHNEDYVDYYIPPDPRQLSRKGALYLVADGMGGHQAGEVASRGAVELVIGQYYGDTTHDVGTSLVRAVRAANRQICEWAQADPSKTGMGTTLVAAVILGRKVYVANVGDSRAYLVTQKGISQITMDHSWVEEQVAAGLLTPEEARQHPQRNVVTRALGSKPSVEVDLFEGELQDGHILFMCSDGLTGHVEDREIASIVRQHPPEKAAQLLVAQANERGGSDNISVIIARAQKQADAALAATVAQPKPARRVPLIPVLAGVAAVLVLVFGGLLVLPGVVGRTPPPVAQISDTATPQLPAAESASPLPPEGTPLQQPVDVPSPTAGPAVEQDSATPTSTLKPTLEATMPAPTATRPPAKQPEAPPAATRTPTNAPQPTYPAPTLLDPQPDESLDGTRRFAWQYDGPELKPDEAFDLRIWSVQYEWNKPSEQRRGAINPTQNQEVQVDLTGAPAIGDYGQGEYKWAVVVVRIPSCYPEPNPGCALVIIGQWSEERAFAYSPAGPPSEPVKPRP